MMGRIVEEPGLSELDLTNTAQRLPVPPPAQVISGIFDQTCRENPALEKLRGRSIYMDYELP